MIVLALSLRAGDRVRAAYRWDVTHDMPDGVWRTWRALTGQRRTALKDGVEEHIKVTLTSGGRHLGTWTADREWPRAGYIHQLEQARRDITEGAHP